MQQVWGEMGSWLDRLSCAVPLSHPGGESMRQLVKHIGATGILPPFYRRGIEA